MPGRLPIGRFDTERSVRTRCRLNFEPLEKEEVWLFSLFEKIGGGDPHWPLWGWADNRERNMGTGGFGSSEMEIDVVRNAEDSGTHSHLSLSLSLLLLCYVMLWILLCLLVFYEVWIWLHIWFTISVQFCPVNGALKKKIFTVNRTCVRGYVCTCSLRASYWSRHRYCNIIHLLLGNNISQIEGTQTLINIRNSISLRIRSIPRTVLDYINFKIEILITIIYFYLLIIKKKRRKIFTPIDTQTCFN